MTERVEAIRQRHGGPHDDLCYTCVLLTALAQAEREREAYKRAKAENDERFMLERDAARDRVEEIRLALEAMVTRGAFTVSEIMVKIKAALAQAERERDELKIERNRSAEYGIYLDKELDTARAEVERLKEELARTRDKADAALARVRATVDGNRKQNILGQFICDDCGKEWPTHDLEFCIVGQIAAALEGR